MTSAAQIPEREFPNLRPEVVKGYRQAPENTVAQVLDGELFVMPRPKPRHSLAITSLTGELHGPFQLGRSGPGGWTILVEPELHLGPKPDIVDPDLAGWTAGRLPPEVFHDDGPAAITIAPDWVCEVLSDSTEAIDRGKKRRIYRREGVRHLWLLDPRDRLLEVYRLEAGHWVEAGEYQGDEKVRVEPFDAIELDLALLWPR
jgi:Uma2 family endonuclease